MKYAFIKLPIKNTPVNGVCNNLHGYWNPPKIVIEFSSNVCLVEFIDDMDYELKVKEITDSYNECINQFYKDNCL